MDLHAVPIVYSTCSRILYLDMNLSFTTQTGHPKGASSNTRPRRRSSLPQNTLCRRCFCDRAGDRMLSATAVGFHHHACRFMCRNWGQRPGAMADIWYRTSQTRVRDRGDGRVVTVRDYTQNRSHTIESCFCTDMY